MDIGFKEAGFDVVWTNEFNPDIADMHEHGMTSLQWSRDKGARIAQISNRSSIVDLKPSDVLKEAFDGKSPKVFGVIGGPPCPDFSVGGKNRGHKGDHGKLSQCYINMICGLKPTFFLMENVPGLVRTAKHKEFLNKLRNQLEKAGYVTDLKILNALEYGSPQDRERVFMVGFKNEFLRKNKGIKDPGSLQDGWYPYPVGDYTGAKTLNWPTECKFGGSPNKPLGLPDKLMVHTVLAGEPLPSHLPNGVEGFTPYSDRFTEINEGDTNKKSFKRLHRYRYSPTACYGNNEVHLHPWEPRRLTVREALRIQTVPDEYILPSRIGLSIKFKMIGNGVPCKLGQAVAESLMKFLT